MFHMLKTLGLIVFLLFGLSTFCQNIDTTFYGGNNSEARSLIRLEDGNFLISGTDGLDGARIYFGNPYLMVLNDYGLILKKREFDFEYYSYGQGVDGYPTNNGYFLRVYTSRQGNAAEHIVVTNKDLEETSQHFLREGIDICYFQNFKYYPLTENRLMLAGTVDKRVQLPESEGIQVWDGFHRIYDANDSCVFDTVFTPDCYTNVLSHCFLPDGAFLQTGTRSDSGLVKKSNAETGEIYFTKDYSKNGITAVNQSISIPNYILTLCTYHQENDLATFASVVLDGARNIEHYEKLHLPIAYPEWLEKVNDNTFAAGFDQYPTGYYVLLLNAAGDSIGFQSFPNPHGRSAQLIKNTIRFIYQTTTGDTTFLQIKAYDFQGNLIQELVIPKLGELKIANSGWLTDSLFYVVGTLNNKSWVLVKPFESAATGFIKTEILPTSAVIFPNPASTGFKVLFNRVVNDEISVYDELGHPILTRAINAKEVYLNVEKNGLYFIRLRNSGWSQKILLN